MIIGCNKCMVTKDIEEFYVSNSNTCKECIKSGVKANREKNKEYYKEYDKKRFQENPKVRERHRRYQATKAGKASMIRSRSKWLENNKEKRTAHNVINNAVRDGRIIKPKSCSKCGATPNRIEGHHPDYFKPPEVVWLCRMCHMESHREQL